MRIPQSLVQTLQQEPALGLFPLVEVELTGDITFDDLVSGIHTNLQTPYKLLTADIEYLGTTNFGKILLHLQGTAIENTAMITYFNQINIQNTIKGYA